MGQLAGLLNSFRMARQNDVGIFTPLKLISLSTASAVVGEKDTDVAIQLDSSFIVF